MKNYRPYILIIPALAGCTDLVDEDRQKIIREPYGYSGSHRTTTSTFAESNPPMEPRYPVAVIPRYESYEDADDYRPGFGDTYATTNYYDYSPSGPVYFFGTKPYAYRPGYPGYRDPYFATRPPYWIRRGRDGHPPRHFPNPASHPVTPAKPPVTPQPPATTPPLANHPGETPAGRTHRIFRPGQAAAIVPNPPVTTPRASAPDERPKSLFRPAPTVPSAPVASAPILKTDTRSVATGGGSRGNPAANRPSMTVESASPKAAVSTPKITPAPGPSPAAAPRDVSPVRPEIIPSREPAPDRRRPEITGTQRPERSRAVETPRSVESSRPATPPARPEFITRAEPSRPVETPRFVEPPRREEPRRIEAPRAPREEIRRESPPPRTEPSRPAPPAKNDKKSDDNRKERKK